METKLIYSKMSQVMKDVGFVGKDQKNTVQGFKFRGVDQFVNALYPALTKNGVFMAPRCVKEEHEIKTVVRSSGKEGVDKHVTIMMEYDFYAGDGSKVTVGPIPAEGLDSGDKATNKALSAALKYALIQTFSVPTEDMTDGDSDSPTIDTTKTVSGSVETKSDKSAEATQQEVNWERAVAETTVQSGFKRTRKTNTDVPVNVKVTKVPTAAASNASGNDLF